MSDFSKISKCRLLKFIIKRKREQYSFFGFFVLPFFQKKQQNKINNIKVNAVTKTTIFINAENTWSKNISPTWFHFRLGQDERSFLKKTTKTTNILLWQGYHRRNVNSDPVAATSTWCHKDRCSLFSLILNDCTNLGRCIDEPGTVKTSYCWVEHPWPASWKTQTLFALIFRQLYQLTSAFGFTTSDHLLSIL